MYIRKVKVRAIFTLYSLKYCNPPVPLFNKVILSMFKVDGIGISYKFALF